MKSGSVQTQETVTNADNFSEFDVDIADQSKVMHMLISGLYSNKPQSITRETWTNARDSHADAGILHKPFDITFPSVFEPIFRVRDYGVGMSHQQITEKYKSLGNSTKETNNVGVGKFGIGSKSPFSYTDTFTITAYDGKTARHYSAVFSLGKKSGIYLLAEVESDEPRGIEISFPVEPNDVPAFCQAAQRVSYGFDVKPNVVEADDNKVFQGWVEAETFTDGPGWRILKAPIKGFTAGSYAKMGCVMYPIDIDAVDGLSTDARELLKANLIIDFPIGSLEPAISRETLQYGRHDPTSVSIKKRAEQILHQMVDTILSDYASCATYWEACAKYRGHVSAGLPYFVRNLIQKKAMWNGQKVESTIPIDCTAKGDFKAVSMCSISGQKLNHVKYVFSYHGYVNVSPTDNTVMFIEDISLPHKEREKRTAARIRNYYATRKNIEQILWVKFSGAGRAESEEFSAMLAQLDGVKIVHVSETEDVTTARSGYATRSPVMARLVSTGMYDEFRTKVTLSPEQQEQGGLYVKIERMSAHIPKDVNVTPGDLVEALKEAGAIPMSAQVYAAPKTIWKDFSGDQWTDVYDFAKDYYEKHATDGVISRSETVKKIRSNRVLRALHGALIFEELGDDSPARLGHEFMAKIISEDTSGAAGMLKLRGYFDPEHKKTDKDSVDLDDLAHANDLADQVKERYPLLTLLCEQYMSKKLEKITKYVYTCDMAAEHIDYLAANVAINAADAA